MKTKNYLNLKSWLLMMLMLIGAGGNLWAEDTTTSYTFSSKSWAATPANWQGTKDGNQFNTSGTPAGVQVTTSSSGVTVSSPKEFSNVKTVTVTYSSSSKGVGSIEVKVGEKSLGSQNISKSQSKVNLTYNATELPSGNVSFIVNCTTNSIGINGIAITEAEETADLSETTTTIDASGITNNDIYESKSAGQLSASVTADGAQVEGASVVWSSLTPSVASVDANGNVTLVGVGEAQIKASYAGAAGQYKSSSATYTFNVVDNTPATVYVKVTDKNQIVKGNEYLLVNANGTKALGAISSTSTSYGTLIDVSTVDNKISIKNEAVNVLTLGDSGYSDWLITASIDGKNLCWSSGNSLTTDASTTEQKVRWKINFSDGTITIRSVKDETRYLQFNSDRFACYTSNQTAITLYVKEGSSINDKENASVSIDVTELTVGGETAQITAVPEGLVMSYESSAPAIASVSNGVVTGLAHGSATITVSWEEQTVGDKTYNAGSREFEISVVDPNRPGTKTNPYTVAQALEFIETLGTESSDIVYVSGIVSQVDKFDDKYSSITYWISDDGTTSSQLECYSGKGLESADFSSVNDIQVGDIVTVAGTLKKYNDIYEFNYNNYLASFERPVYEITAKSNNEDLGTVSLEGNIITATLKDGSRYADPAFTVDAEGEVTVEQDGNEFVVVAKSNCTVTINFEQIPSHNVVWSINGEETTTTALEDAAVEFPAAPEAIEGKTFVGWVTAVIDGEADTEPEFVTSAIGAAGLKFYAVFATQETEASQYEKTDDLTREFTGVEEKATYAEWSGKNATSGAVYAGQSAGDKNSIQLRSNNSNSGVISTTSGGKLAKVVVEWNSETANGRTLDVYGSNTAYTAATDLYDNSTRGTKLGNIVYGTSTELTISGDYQYIGLRSNSGAMYLTSVSITWEGGTPATYSGYCTTVDVPIVISTVEELKTFRDAVNGGNTFVGKTVKLSADLDLSGEENWTPIGNLVAYPTESFNGVFDGDGHKISNVTVVDNTPNHAVAGLFGSVVNGTIKNLTVENVNLTSSHYAGGIVAYTSNKPIIENCHVIGGTITSVPELINGSYDNGDKVGGIMGYATAGSTINNCTVDGLTIKAYRDMGGIVGFSAGNVTNNTVKNTTIIQSDVNAYKNEEITTYDYIVGRNGGATLENNVYEELNNVLTIDGAVAKIGDKLYRKLQAAVDAAQQLGGAQTINLLDNISGETVTIKEVANFQLTIDGKKDAESNYTVDAQIIVDGLRGNGGSNTNGASVTLQNIAFVNNAAKDAILPSHYPHHLTIQNCSYAGSEASLNNWFVNVSDGPLYGATIKDVTVEHSRLIQGNLGLDVVFENIVATNDVKCGFNIKTEGTVLIKDCQVTTAKYAFRDYKEDYVGTITLEGNTFISTSEESDEGVIVNRGGAVGTGHINVVSGTYSGHIKVLNSKEGVLAISGGIFSESIAEAYCADGYICIANPDTETNEAYPYAVAPRPYVAQIGDVQYYSLAEAVAAVPADGTETTIMMIEDETIDVSGYAVTVAAKQNVVLELNGHQIVGACTSNSTSALIRNLGTLTIQDNTDANKDGSGNGKLIAGADPTWTWDGSDNYSGSYASNLVRNEGTLVVESGNLLNVSTGSAAYGIDNYSAGNVTINGGKVDAAKASAIRLFYNNGGSITVTGGIIGHYNSDEDCSYMGVQVQSGTAEVIISGGTFYGLYSVYAGNNKCSITGGLFSTDVSHYCAEGLACIPSEQYPGMYEIGLAEVYYSWIEEGAEVGEYCTFAAPFINEWLCDGEFITLQKDVTLTEDIACQLAEGSFNLTLGEYNITKGDYSVSLKPNVSVLTDKQTDIFSAAEAGYMIEEAEVEGGFTYTAVKVEVAAPIVFHDGGTYEEALTVPMIAQAGAEIYYSTDGTTFTKYTQPIEISATTTVTAYAMLLGAKSSEVTKTFEIVTKQAGPTVTDGYYNIKTNGDKYVNVAGRKTVTLVDDNEGMPGTVIRVKATNGKVETLRSQGVDVPSYAQKAMNYVPEIVQLAVDKLHAEGAGELLGEHGLKAIMDKFDKSFDYNLYLEGENNTYRIYGKTPSMKPVVDFYAENKDNVDAKLPQLEAFINSAIDKVLQKTNGSGASILVDFELHKVWENMDGTLTEPVDEASTAKFYEEVLTSEANVWNFAYQTAMIYWGNLKNHPRFAEIQNKLGDYSKYIDKVENIRPNFRYYIVPSASGVDFISQGNSMITDASTAWTMEPVSEFTVNFETEQTFNIYPTTSGGETFEAKEYYTTLYTDFAYTLPEDGSVKAYKVTEITEKYGVAKREEITGVIPAQTPVLLVTSNEGAQTTLTLTTEAGTAVTGNLLVGADALINEYQIKTPQVESLFNLAKDVIGESAYNEYLKKYEHLMLTNAGTVNNKYFFGLSAEDVEKCVVKNEKNEEDCVIRSLSTGDEKIGFYNNWSAGANKAFLVTSDFNPVKLSLVGDVDRDGKISIGDVTALVNIILGKATYPKDNDKYDFEAAEVDGDKKISIADVTKLVNIILGKE